MVEKTEDGGIKMPVDPKAILLAALEDFSKRHGMCISRVILRVSGSGTLLKQLKTDRSISSKTYMKLMRFMARYDQHFGPNFNMERELEQFVAE